MTLEQKVLEVANYVRNDWGGKPEDVPDWYIADFLNERKTSEVVRVYKPIKVSEVRFVLLVSGEYPRVKEYAINNRANDGYVYGAIPFDIIEGMNEIDLNIPNAYNVFKSTLDLFFDKGVISEQSKNTLLGMVRYDEVVVWGKSWAEENNLTIDSRAVGLARGGKP